MSTQLSTHVSLIRYLEKVGEIPPAVQSPVQLFQHLHIIFLLVKKRLGVESLGEYLEKETSKAAA